MIEKTIPSLVGALVGSLLVTPTTAAEPRNDVVVRKAMTDELTRTMKDLAIAGEAKPYFVAYTLHDSDDYMASGALGAVTLESTQPSRAISVSLRVGSPELDNSNAGTTGEGAPVFGGSPIEDDYVALRRELWLASDARYKGALETLAFKKNAVSRVSERSEAYPDFSNEPKHETVVPGKTFDHAESDRALRRNVERLSLVLSSTPNLLESGAFVERSSERRRLLTSEGTWADETYHTTRVSMQALMQADDGMILQADLDFTGREPSTLPSSEVMETKTKEALSRLVALRTAPLAESGTAIVLFEGLAAAQLVETLLVPRLSGAPPVRYMGVDADRSLASRLGLEVISPELDVFDDPTLRTGPRGEPLWGSYVADDEGVPARRVSLIERGVLKTLLMSRAPRKEIRQSNGHYCHGVGVHVGNLFVKAARPLSRSKLLALAEREAKKRDGATKVYVVRRLASSRAFAGMGPWFMARAGMSLWPERGMIASEAYLVTGGKERPVRGLAIESMDLRALKELLAAGDDAYVMNYESGCVAAIVAPPLLLPNIDVKRDEGDNPKPPSYPPPR